jgi:hypothetical protein
MKAKYFADKRDLVKWGVLLLLADQYRARSILQVAYYRSEPWPRIDLDGELRDLPDAVRNHFRKLESVTAIQSNAKVTVLMDTWNENERRGYHLEVVRRVGSLPSPRIVFLDPDTGLEPDGKARHEHVREEELYAVWRALRLGDVLVFYQHAKRSKNWIAEKKAQFESAMGVEPGTAKVARAPEMVGDVVLFWLAKT